MTHTIFYLISCKHDGVSHFYIVLKSVDCTVCMDISESRSWQEIYVHLFNIFWKCRKISFSSLRYFAEEDIIHFGSYWQSFKPRPCAFCPCSVCELEFSVSHKHIELWPIIFRTDHIFQILCKVSLLWWPFWT